MKSYLFPFCAQRAGGENREQRFGSDTLLVFETGELHAVRAEGEELVFVTFLHGAPGAQ
jgi:hypothetical protein